MWYYQNKITDLHEVAVRTICIYRAVLALHPSCHSYPRRSLITVYIDQLLPTATTTRFILLEVNPVTTDTQ